MKRAICSSCIAWSFLVCFGCLVCFCVGLAETTKPKQVDVTLPLFMQEEQKNATPLKAQVLIIGSLVWLPVGITLACVGVAGVQELDLEQQKQDQHRKEIEEELALLKPKMREVKVIPPPPPPPPIPKPKKVEKDWNKDQDFQDWLKNNQERKG